jgi:hypothetical protein
MNIVERNDLAHSVSQMCDGETVDLVLRDELITYDDIPAVLVMRETGEVTLVINTSGFSLSLTSTPEAVVTYLATHFTY